MNQGTSFFYTSMMETELPLAKLCSCSLGIVLGCPKINKRRRTQWEEERFLNDMMMKQIICSKLWVLRCPQYLQFCKRLKVLGWSKIVGRVSALNTLTWVRFLGTHVLPGISNEGLMPKCRARSKLWVPPGVAQKERKKKKRGLEQ